MKTVWLQFERYDDFGGYQITNFEVYEKWLIEQLDEPLEEFLEEYTSDEAIPLYELAVLHKQVLNEETIKQILDDDFY